jgi:hypothetical protein
MYVNDHFHWSVCCLISLLLDQPLDLVVRPLPGRVLVAVSDDRDEHRAGALVLGLHRQPGAFGHHGAADRVVQGGGPAGDVVQHRPRGDVVQRHRAVHEIVLVVELGERQRGAPGLGPLGVHVRVQAADHVLQGLRHAAAAVQDDDQVGVVLVGH